MQHALSILEALAVAAFFLTIGYHLGAAHATRRLRTEHRNWWKAQVERIKASEQRRVDAQVYSVLSNTPGTAEYIPIYDPAVDGPLVPETPVCAPQREGFHFPSGA